MSDIKYKMAAEGKLLNGGMGYDMVGPAEELDGSGMGFSMGGDAPSKDGGMSYSMVGKDTGQGGGEDVCLANDKGKIEESNYTQNGDKK